LLLKIVELPNEAQRWRRCPQVLRICGLILGAEVLLCCFKTAPNILVRQWMAVGKLS
jgi:hypothetical protein